MKKIVSLISAAAILGAFAFPVNAADNAKLLAFPGAEGGGKYTTGARGGDSIEVYHVTNLNADGEGSFKDAVSKPNRVIVFDVSGIITLPEKLKIQQSNLTILGQTAPGDGITIAGADVEIAGNNNIIRYLRVRPTDSYEGEPDGLGGRWIQDVIVDHCSVSWGVDELLTLYAGSRESEDKKVSENITVQNCISSESLKMSSHIKGSHGYGGIAGGTNYSFHHNLIAHNDSRNPRLDRNLSSTDITNNVIYDWGMNSIYGAEPYSYNKQEEFSNPDCVSNVNIRNNYYKFGPSTRFYDGEKVRNRVFEVTNDGTVEYNGEMLKSNIYISGNYVYGDEEATDNNWKDNSTVKNQEKANKLEEPIDMGEYSIPEQTAQEAYEDVLATAGASLPRRDSIDARIVNDVKNGTGRLINKTKEAGSFTGVTSEKRTFEIPQDWKDANGMGNAAETDIVGSGEWKGYTWIEAYVNDWTQEQSAPSNPSITVETPVVASYDMDIDKTEGKGSWPVLTYGEKLAYKAKAEAVNNVNVTGMELYDGTRLIKSYDGAYEIDDSIELGEGTHYIFSRAYNEKGEKTDSPVSIVYVNGEGLEGAELTELEEIGTPSFEGKSAAWYDKSGDTYYIGGSGLTGGEADSCSFVYTKVNGDFSASVKIGAIPKYDNGVLSGMMVRESTDPSSDMVFLGDGWLKGGENITVVKRINGESERVFMPLEDGSQADNSSNEHEMPEYMKIERSGDKLTLSVANADGDWNGNDRKPMTIDISGWGDELCLGLAIDSNDGVIMLPYYSQASFSDFVLNN